MSESGEVCILVIEDQENDFLMLQEKICGWGGESLLLEHAETLQAGFELCRLRRYEAVLLDLGLPDSQGVEGVIKFNKQFPDLPVVVLTGLDDDQLGLNAIRSGAQDYLVKGEMTPEVIRRVLNYAIERKRGMIMKDHFMNLVSHELKGPLFTLQEINCILMNGEEGTVTEKQKELLIMTARTIERMLRTATNLLDLARLEVRKMPLQKKSFDFPVLIHEVAQSFRLPMLKKGIQLTESFQKETCVIHADRDKVAQVLSNLIHNALKFTEAGFIQVAFFDRGEHEVECRVADSGPGLSAEDLQRVFNKYEQFGQVAAGSEKGTGLGLAICKEIIEMHQGKISVESQKGKGSIFFFTLPKN